MTVQFLPANSKYGTINNMSNNGLRIEDERQTGVYVWLMPNGSIVQDDEGHILSLPARKGDVRRANIMIDYVRGNHPEALEGRPVWVSNRQVTDDEYDHQFQRAAFGLTPDPLDDFIQEVKEGKRHV